MKSLEETPTNANSSRVALQKILVAVDYLASTPTLFKQACDLAQKYNGSLMIFHCVKGHLPGMQDVLTASSIATYSGVYSSELLELEEQVVAEAKEELQQWLKSFCQDAIEQGISAEFDYSIGEPGRQICAKAKDWGADLIVVGRRGRKGISEMMLGSVSNYITHHAHCSVFIMQG